MTVPVQTARVAARPHPRRRPSGEPPALPHTINASGKLWLAGAVGVVGFWIVVAFTRRTGLAMDVVDHAILQRVTAVRTAWLTHVMRVLAAPATGLGVQLIWLLNLAVLAFYRRWRHLLVWLVSGLLVDTISGSIAETIERPRPFGIEILGAWKGYAMPSLPMAVLSAFLVSTLYSMVPAGRPRRIGKLVVLGVLLLVTLARLYLAQDAATDAVFGVVIGVTVPLLAFRLFAPNEVFPVTYRRGRTAHLDINDRRRDAIERALQDQLCLVTEEITPFGLAGSGGSTPLRVKVKGDPDHFVLAKLYSQIHLRSDRWYKLGRTLLYGRLEDEKPFNTVRRLVQYEDYLLRLLHAARLPVPKPYGIVEITPEREYLVVMEFFDGAVEIGDAQIDDSIIDQGLRAVRRMWEAGLAHRDIKPANVMIRDGRLLLVDPAFAQVRPSPWRQAVDLANMMLVLALRTDARQVYDRARAEFSDDEIAEAFAASRGLTMPSQLRRMLRSQGRNLHAELIAMLPYRLPPVHIQRWSVRRLALTVVVLLTAVVATVLGLQLILNNPL
jgi:tRNA A-37 threonylcarbamoyl transferase component Bud32